MKSGIYTITNVKNGRRYIGSASHFAQRFAQHRMYLKRGDHQNSYLQRAWNKYGEDAFVFEVIQEVANLEDLIATEQAWIDRYWSDGLYNRRRFAASNLGVKHTPESKAKLSAAHKKLALNPTSRMIEGRKKVGAKNRGRKATSETRDRMAAAHALRVAENPTSEATREKIRQVALNRTQEQIDKAAAGRQEAFIVTTPEGEEIEIVGLAKFARENGLTQANLSKVLSGERKQHKGYTVRRAA